MKSEVVKNESQTIEETIQVLRDLVYDSESLHSEVRKEIFDALCALKKIKKYL